MHYDTLLFDMDSTLLGFNASEAESFQSMPEEKGEPFSGELFSTYKTMSKQMWRTMERGEAAIPEVLGTRLSRLMSRCGKQTDGVKWENCYRGYLNRGIQEMPGVHQILKQLKERFRLYVITNGAEETQHYRLEGAGMMGYLDGIFISQSTGAGRPTKEFFDYVKEHIESLDTSHSLVIGDPLTSDILDGQTAGMDTCWFCKEGSENLLDEEPTCVIHDLQDLLEILER